MITKEQRNDLVQALENGDPVDCDEGLLLQALRQVDTLETRFEAVQNANFQSASERITLVRKNRALKHEIRKLHRAREQDWEAGKRWRKEFIEYSERLRAERLTADKRIAELEAAAQWRPMDTAPRDGTWILVLMSPEPSGIHASASVLRFHDAPFADFWRNAHWDRFPELAGYGWLPIPALPEGAK